MLALEKWGEGKYLPMVMLAQEAALYSQEWHEIIIATRENNPRRIFNSPSSNPRLWFDLYSKPFRFWETITLGSISPTLLENVDDLVSPSPFAQSSFEAELVTAIQTFVQKPDLQRRRDISLRLLKRYYRQHHLPKLKEMIQNQVSFPEHMEHWQVRLEPSFMLSVVVPCWIEYNSTPWELFQRAKQRDDEALEMLLRIDPEVDKHPRLQRIMLAMPTSNPGRYRQLQKARSEGRKKKITISDVKYLLGGMLLKYTDSVEQLLRGEPLIAALEAHVTPTNKHLLHKQIKQLQRKADRSPQGCRLRWQDICELFHAVSQDRYGKPYDVDFHGEPNSISKQLQRKSKLYPDLQNSDIKRAA